ncbi:FAD-dependent oxidoreductase [Nocardioides koreensis]|uniref:FAD-dependent oxidoreductase n=1 Tax=Nocardioides koreensis TaxID=433651 RepID=A0ABP5KU53_9ACTN
MRRERLVVVGNGMAATRLVEELLARGYDGHVTVLGDEPVPAYNRILLSAVLEGSHPRGAIELRGPTYDPERVEVRLGCRVLEVDRDRREVMLVDGERPGHERLGHERLGYDRLVLATGSIPTLPPIRGLVRMDGQLHPNVHAFRSLADADRLETAIRSRQARPTGTRAVVVGGGLLGLQVARALTVRGLATEVVEGTEHLLSRQVGAPGGRILARDLRRLGTEVYTGTRAVRLTDDGLVLDNGFTLETDLVVLTAGGRPSTALARRAGLLVRRGVVIDGRLASVTDERVHAIGDCAERRGVTTGFVPPAWEQAAALAALLAGGSEEYAGSRTVARLRATGLDVAVLGDPERTDGEVVEMTNPLVGSHRRLVVRDGVIVAAALVGDLSQVGLITQHYDRRTVLGPHEPGELLAPEGAGAAPPADLADDVEVCACAGVTAGRVRACAGLEEVRSTTRATTGCGGCGPVVRHLLEPAAAGVRAAPISAFPRL